MDGSIIEPELEEESKPSLIKRIVIGTISIFLILLIMSYLGVGSEIVHLLSGRLASYEIQEDHSINLKDGTNVFFDSNTYQELVSVWNENRLAEFKVCLSGIRNNNNYYISSITYPIIFEQSVFSVTAELCPEDTLIPLHSHPDNRCLYSRQDSRSHKAFAKINPNSISSVMCSSTRFGFYQ
jgi:hypothetical protein